MLWIRRIWLQLLAQLQNLIIYGPRGRIRVVSPDLVEQDLTCEHTVKIICKKLQQLELVSGEDYGDTAAACSHTLEVDLTIREAKDGRPDGFPLPTNCRLNAGCQFSWAEGLS